MSFLESCINLWIFFKSSTILGKKFNLMNNFMYNFDYFLFRTNIFLFFQAYIRIGSSRCGGTLVNRFHVVTAGHCVAKYTYLFFPYLSLTQNFSQKSHKKSVVFFSPGRQRVRFKWPLGITSSTRPRSRCLRTPSGSEKSACIHTSSSRLRPTGNFFFFFLFD